MQRMPASVIVALVLSALLVVAGLLLIVAAPQASASFGWFAYQPLSESVFIPGGFIVLTQPVIIGAAVGVLGLVGLGVVLGFVLGRRPRRSE